jgi:hypothetical protein
MNRRTGAMSIIFVALLALVGSVLWMAESGAATRSSGIVVPPNEVAGASFQVHTDGDSNYCLEDVPSDLNQSPFSISQCAARDSEHWMFAQLSNGARGIIDGSGSCLQTVGKKSVAIAVAPCTLKGNQQFIYSESGQITTTNGKSCLQYAAATQNAAVTIPKCVAGLKAQIWPLTH